MLRLGGRSGVAPAGRAASRNPNATLALNTPRTSADPRLRLGSESEASVWRSVDKANAIPRPAKPARQNVARPRRWANALARPQARRPRRSGKFAAPALPA